MIAGRPYDIVVYGASGFVGKLVARYLADSPSAAGLRWALGGRDRSKLEAVRGYAGVGGRPADVVLADSRDASAIDALVRQSRVVLNTAGPFALHGDPVVDACVRHGTHYVDITGETVWIGRLIERHHEAAAARSTRIVPSCGFDSVPSDLGAFLMVRHIQRELGAACRSVTAYYRMYGGFNGGTIASLMHMHETGELAARLSPYALDPPETVNRARDRVAADMTHSRYDPDIDAWIGPFFMAPMNTRLVRRSAALFEGFGETYGPSFDYREYLKYEAPFGRLKAGFFTNLLVLFEAALERPRMRNALKRILPRPGEGPSDRTIRNGWFRCELVGVAEDGRRVRGLITHSGDPSNSATTEFVSEAALTLALDADKLPGGDARGGVLTPATALGEPLADRMKAAGTRIEIGGVTGWTARLYSG